MTRHSSKPSELRNVYPVHVRGRTGNVTIQKWKFAISESKSARLLSILDETNPVEIDKCQSKNVASVSEVLALFNYSSDRYIQ